MESTRTFAFPLDVAPEDRPAEPGISPGAPSAVPGALSTVTSAGPDTETAPATPAKSSPTIDTASGVRYLIDIIPDLLRPRTRWCRVQVVRVGYGDPEGHSPGGPIRGPR